MGYPNFGSNPYTAHGSQDYQRQAPLTLYLRTLPMFGAIGGTYLRTLIGFEGICTNAVADPNWAFANRPLVWTDGIAYHGDMPLNAQPKLQFPAPWDLAAQYAFNARYQTDNPWQIH